MWRGADRHYDLLKTRFITDVVRSSGLWTPAEHAHCWMWVTDNFLTDGLWVMRKLGFEYVRTAVWVKAEDEEQLEEERQQLGLGQYLRGSHELLLFGTRGSGMDPSVWTGARDVKSVIYERRRRHSQKPESSYQLIERVSRGPRVEFFARTPREGWTVWGNEVAA